MRFHFRRLFYRGKHIKKENSDGLTAMLLPSMLGILACAICLAGTTFAWFSVTQNTEMQTIQAANFSVAVSVDGKAAGDMTALEVGTHTVSITANGTATTGYCIIEFGEQKLHTAQISADENLSFVFEVNEAVTLNITPQWGTSAMSEDDKLHSGETLIYGEPAPLTCTCETKCAELNEACEVCKADFALCIGKETICTCETKCTELNSSCDICKTDFTLCIGAAVTPPEAPAEDEPPAAEQGEPQGEQPAEGVEETTPPAESTEETEPTEAPEETQAPAGQESSEDGETAPPADDDINAADPAILPPENSEDGEEQPQQQTQQETQE